MLLDCLENVDQFLSLLLVSKQLVEDVVLVGVLCGSIRIARQSSGLEGRHCKYLVDLKHKISDVELRERE